MDEGCVTLKLGVEDVSCHLRWHDKVNMISTMFGHCDRLTQDFADVVRLKTEQ